MMKAEKFWDFIARGYDQGEGDPAARQDIQSVKKYLRAGDVVLDYACGSGTLAVEIAGLVKEVHAVDLSSKMLATARHKASERKIDNIVFTQSTLSDLRYPPGAFDVILAFNILHLIEDVPWILQGFSELLQPGGLFISLTPCLGEKRTLINHLLSPFFMVPSKLGIIPYIRIFKASELEDFLAGGNFQIIETVKFVHGISDYLIIARKTGGVA